ncbi:ribosomal protection-like ABC-F family protein [Roseburia sp. AM59-24XD]|uniref:ribosomal protection-like ABC-F family protein n=1 Tax=Roseburia sp. AM59-24XD TaxID=2293138 RepID=UPI000E50FA94|nr:ABC-F type ribosomal protection protein [Roseburia sp. AM59-24XD]RHP89003.1 ABC transporter ATP-binding protein [Roseburia sp. AM59-24XD]
MILQCSHISKSFDGNTILNDISFHINEQEKTAIVGVNGSGKSTLLKILMGEYEADDGEIIIQKDAVIGYLAQNQDIDSAKSVLEEMQDAKKDVIALEQELNDITEQMNHASGEELEHLIAKSDTLRHRFELAGGYTYHSELIGVLKGLGFTEEEFNKPVSALSGGERTRVALGKMLLTSPDLIILDEPTNHLDMKAIRWLEGYLSGYRGAVIIVAHDRYFLDRIVTKVVEIRQHKSTVYQGNYSQFSEKKQALLDTQMKQYLNQQAEIKHQEAVIAKLKSFNREKSVKRAESREKQLDKIERLDKPVEENTRMNLLFSPRIQSGNDVLSIEHLSKAFDSEILFTDISFELKRGERVAIIGDNGSGKTTILKIINDLVKADAGTIRLGTNVEIGYYDQAHQVLHAEKTIFEELQDDYPSMTNTEIRNILAAFLFTDDDVFKQISKLSGGERGRVSLAKLMLSDANLLILDEPTNHLDIDSKEILERAVNHFEGTVLYVSHDRYFINRTATRILDLTQKQLVNYIGNYDYYLEKKEANEQAQLTTPVEPATDTADNGASDSKLTWQQQKEEQARLRKKQNALNKVEKEISELEAKNESLDEQLSDPKNGTDIALLQKLASEKEANDERLLTLMEEWENLAED